MNAFEAYKDYVALKQHFSTDGYDYVRYNGQIQTTPKASAFVKWKVFFEKLAKHRDPHSLLIANFIQNNKAWIRDIAYSEQAEELYKQRERILQSITYTVISDLKKLDGDFNSLLATSDSHPPLVIAYLGRKISLETLCVIADLTGILPHWTKAYPYDPVMSEVLFKVRKYKPFVPYDKRKIKDAVVREFTQRQA